MSTKQARWGRSAYLHLVEVEHWEVLLARVSLAPVDGQDVPEVPRDGPPHPGNTRRGGQLILTLWSHLKDKKMNGKYIPT